MSFSPPIRRLSNASSIVNGEPLAVRKHEEELINAYEAEEERIINVLSRKLEQLREDKIDLENALEAESENHVNRLSRELGVLRVAHQQLQQQLAQTQQSQAGSPQNFASTSTSGIPINGHGSSHVRSPSSASSSVLLMDSPSASASALPDTSLGYRAFMSSAVASGPLGARAAASIPGEPSAEMMLEAMRRENEQLRNRLVDTERDYIRISRLNEVYREELIEHRRRLGISVDNLIGLSSDPYSQPTHHRSTSSSSSSSPGPHAFYSNASSPSTSVFHIPTSYAARHNHSSGVYAQPVAHPPNASYLHYQFGAHSIASNSTHVTGVPIPRPSSQVHRPKHLPLSAADDVDTVPIISSANTPLSPSPSSASMDSGSPYPFSPLNSTSASYTNPDPASFVSVSTNVTSPPSSMSLQMGMGAFNAVPQRGLSYPSVPPPSLSSSFGSPVVSFHMPQRDPSLSPIEPLSRRNSIAGGGRRGSVDRRVAETGTLVRNVSHNNSASVSRRASIDRGSLPIGARVAETGTLVGRRSRAGSVNQGGQGTMGGHSGQMPETVAEADDTEGMELGIENDGEENQLTGSVILPSVSMKLAAGVGNGKHADSEIPIAKSR